MRQPPQGHDFRFGLDHFPKLRILNADTGDLISRKDAFIPVNCWLDVAAADARIDTWKRLAEERLGIVVPATD